VTLFTVVFHYGAGGNFFGSPTVAAARFSLFFDVLVHPLLFGSDAAEMFSAWHGFPPSKTPTTEKRSSAPLCACLL
jgi:hypothetical protein